MQSNVLKVANDYQMKNIPYAMAFVVRREKPTSGKQGDKAIILEDGKIIGWIGGGCTRPVVINEAKMAIKEGTPRLIRISPDVDSPQTPGVKHYEMTCFSGGSVDVYIEPVLGKQELVILGRSAIAQSLARISYGTNYQVSMFAKDEIPMQHDSIKFSTEGYNLDEMKITRNTSIVVSTQGEDDEGALEEVLKTDAGYIGFVVSRPKWQTISALLQKQGYTEEQLQRIHAPAGLDINAKKPHEVAISILAEMVEVNNTRLESEESKVEVADAPEMDVGSGLEIDPICKMKVDPEIAEYTAEYEGKNYYFCCMHCKQTFLDAPKQYA